MNTDEEHLRLLSIFHYVVAAMAAIIAGFPLIHVTLGLVMVLAPQSMGPPSGPPPAFIGWFFVVMGGLFVFLGLCFAGMVFYGGRCIAKRKHYTFCLVAAGLSCLFMPFGTVLGVFTLVVLMRPTVKQLFEVAPPLTGPG